VKDLTAKVKALERHLDRAIRVEAELAGTLRCQERAMLRGAADQVTQANQALDGVYHELKSVADHCRRAVADLHSDLGLHFGAPLADVIARLPQGLAPKLAERRERLSRARGQAHLQVSRNSALARSSLDAIASVRGILSRALQAPEAANATVPLSRLDARA